MKTVIVAAAFFLFVLLHTIASFFDDDDPQSTNKKRPTGHRRNLEPAIVPADNFSVLTHLTSYLDPFKSTEMRKGTVQSRSFHPAGNLSCIDEASTRRILASTRSMNSCSTCCIDIRSKRP
jgi:hypothetical protein